MQRKSIFQSKQKITCSFSYPPKLLCIVSTIKFSICLPSKVTVLLLSGSVTPIQYIYIILRCWFFFSFSPNVLNIKLDM